MVLADDRLEFPVEAELRRLVFAGAADVRAPSGQLFAAFFRRDGFVVSHVVHFPAKGIECGHGIAFGARQHHKGERQVGGAFAGDRAALLHYGGEVGGGTGGFSAWRTGGSPPVWARVTLGRRSRWWRRYMRFRLPGLAKDQQPDHAPINTKRTAPTMMKKSTQLGGNRFSAVSSMVSKNQVFQSRSRPRQAPSSGILSPKPCSIVASGNGANAGST